MFLPRADGKLVGCSEIKARRHFKCQDSQSLPAKLDPFETPISYQVKLAVPLAEADGFSNCFKKYILTMTLNEMLSIFKNITLSLSKSNTFLCYSHTTDSPDSGKLMAVDVFIYIFSQHCSKGIVFIH